MVTTDRAPFACRSYLDYSLARFRAVLPGGTFPGPVIRGNKGDRFKLTVINNLTDATMLRSTSIVRPSDRYLDICSYFDS